MAAGAAHAFELASFREFKQHLVIIPLDRETFAVRTFYAHYVLSLANRAPDMRPYRTSWCHSVESKRHRRHAFGPASRIKNGLD